MLSCFTEEAAVRSERQGDWNGCVRHGMDAVSGFRALLCLLGLTLLGACGGGGGDDGYGGSAQAGDDPGSDVVAEDAPGGSDAEGSDAGTPDPEESEPEPADDDDAGDSPDPGDPGSEAPPESPPEAPPEPPVQQLRADAGSDAAVSELSRVYLDGLGTETGEAAIIGYRWDQMDGPIVAINDPLAARTYFNAPLVGGQQTLQFRLTVTDSDGETSADTVSIDIANAQAIPDDANEFLTFLDDASDVFTGSEESAEAYYRAIDPLNEKTSLEDWLTANDFDGGSDASAVYRNAADLGFGRVMSMRVRNDGSVAAYVENYATLDEAVDAVDTGIRNGLLATVAMEYSPGPLGGSPYTKFYTFGPDDERITSIDLDGRGAKFMPGLCNVCHGGQPQALVAGEFPQQGDTHAQFLPWDLETYEFSSRPGYTRVDQEPMLRALNAGSLGTYPQVPVDGQWSGAAARELVEGWYGGPGLPSATADPQFVPEGWIAEVNGGPVGNPSGIEDLYLDVIAPNCRACHIMRGRYYDGLEAGELIDLGSYAKLMAWSDVLEDLLYEKGTMPDALVTFDQFWTDHDGVVGAEQLARYLDVDATSLRPGLPIADPGPNRRAAMGTVVLDASASAFAQTFQWSFAPGGRPSGSSATINGAGSASASFVADTPGVYVARLVVSGNGETSEPVDVRITATFATAPASFSADIVPIVASTCAGCHSVGRAQSVAGIPVRFDEPLALYERLQQYVKGDDISASLLLSKPSGTRHGGGVVPGFDLSGAAGSSRADYDRVLQWISENMPDD